MPLSPVPSGYAEALEQLKAEIGSARSRAASAVNAELIGLNWRIGREILDRQTRETWGTKVVERLASDLKAEFPEMKGLSRTNLMYMRSFADAWPNWDDAKDIVGRLPWGHNIDLLTKLETEEERRFYASRAIEYDWSRTVLQTRIATKLIAREGQALTNFSDRLDGPAAKAAQAITRDPYTFDFLDLSADAQERDLEKALLADLRKFMLELGAGFAFVGSQYHLEVDGEDFYIDLLFFHIPTNRYVVIDLKLEKFRPKDAGQINFYVNVIDDTLREPHHAPSIGLVLCATRSETIVRYALAGIDKPVGVAAWQATESVAALEARANGADLPPVREIERGLERIVEAHAEELGESELATTDHPGGLDSEPAGNSDDAPDH